ncbi:MAG: ion transporter [Lentisphaeria bacterium]|nr:ion transporter [Lentisphaeria bacterium]
MTYAGKKILSRRGLFVLLNREPVWIYFVTGLILLNILAVCLESMPSMRKYEAVFLAFELFSVMLFGTEYLLRLFSCTAAPRYRHAVFGRVRYMFTPMMLIDFLAIVPFFIPFAVGDLRAMRVFRMFRILRIAKIGRYNQSLNLILTVLKARREELIICFGLFGVLILLGSLLLYSFENPGQPEQFSSIPATMWYVILAATSISGSGPDPATLAGRVVLSLISIVGAAMLALPIGIVGAGFLDELQAEREARKNDKSN